MNEFYASGLSGITVNWLALYRYGMDFGNMGFLPYLEFTPMLSPDPALRHRHSKEEWRRLIDEFQDSGLSRQKFCASRGISLPRLTRWMAFFRRESPSPTLSPFVDLGAVNQSASVSGPHVELVLDLGDGIVMTLRRAS